MNHFTRRMGVLALLAVLSACAGPSAKVAPRGEPVRFEIPVSNHAESAGVMLGYRIEHSAPRFLILNSSASVLGPIDVPPGKEVKLVLEYDYPVNAPLGCFDIAIRTRTCSPNVWPRYSLHKVNFIGVPSGGWAKELLGSVAARISCLWSSKHATPIDPSSNNQRPPDCPAFAERPSPRQRISATTKEMAARGDPEAVLAASEDIIQEFLSPLTSGFAQLSDRSVDVSSAPAYSAADLAKIDRCLDSWEASERNLDRESTYECVAILSRGEMLFIADLFLFKQRLAKQVIGSADANYYKTGDHIREYVRLVAKHGLGDERLSRIQRIFLKHLSSERAEIKIRAISWLTGPYQSSETLRAVANTLNSPDQRIRIAAAVGLEQNGTLDGRPILIEALRMQDVQTFLTAAQALGKNVPQPFRLRLEEMARGEGHIDIIGRVRALLTLSTVEGIAAAPIYVEALRTPDRYVSSAGLSALNVSGSSAVLTYNDYEFIADILTRPGLSNFAKTAALGIFAYAESPSVRELLIRRFRGSGDADLRAGLARAMVAMGKKSDVAWLMTYLDDSSEGVQKSAEAALSKITSVRFYEDCPKHEDRVAQRKTWWTRHTDDPEYR